MEIDSGFFALLRTLTAVALPFAHASAMSVGVHLPAPFNAVAYCRAGVVGHVHHFDALASDDVVASVCCPAKCGRCGGVDCWTQPGGEDCCARHVYDRKVPCLNEGDVGCVLPLAAAERLPFSQRDTECVDAWSVAYPDEQGGEQWAGHSCPHKVGWGQCDRFYSFCACSCGYCAPTRAACDAHGAAPPRPPPRRRARRRR